MNGVAPLASAASSAAERRCAVKFDAPISRTLPHAHDDRQNALRNEARRILSTYGDMEEMVRLGAYRPGANAEVDEAIRTAPRIEALLNQGKADRGRAADAFASLAALLETGDEDTL